MSLLKGLFQLKFVCREHTTIYHHRRANRIIAYTVWFNVNTALIVHNLSITSECQITWKRRKSLNSSTFKSLTLKSLKSPRSDPDIMEMMQEFIKSLNSTANLPSRQKYNILILLSILLLSVWQNTVCKHVSCIWTEAFRAGGLLMKEFLSTYRHYQQRRTRFRGQRAKMLQEFHPLRQIHGDLKNNENKKLPENFLPPL